MILLYLDSTLKPQETIMEIPFDQILQELERKRIPFVRLPAKPLSLETLEAQHRIRKHLRTYEDAHRNAATSKIQFH